MAKIVAHKEGYLELTLRQGSADANASNNGTSFRFIFVGISVINVTNGHEKCIRGQIGFVQDSIEIFRLHCEFQRMNETSISLVLSLLLDFGFFIQIGLL